MEYLVELRFTVVVIADTVGGTRYPDPEDVRRQLAKIVDDGFQSVDQSIRESHDLTTRSYEHRVLLR